MYFESIKLSEWQQFSDVKIDFHDRLTVLTGANGSGKTTVLNLLAKHYGWNMTSLATPKAEKSSGIVSFFQDYGTARIRVNCQFSVEFHVQNSNAAQYQIQIPKLQSVKCFFIPSHRSIYRYQPINQSTFQQQKKISKPLFRKWRIQE